MVRYSIFLILAYHFFMEMALGAIHTAPIVVQGFRIRETTKYPISMYRLFASDEKGRAISIPFQIDEINEEGDYILREGSTPTEPGNGIFDIYDELVFMGDDVGPLKKPTAWGKHKPSLLYEIKISLPTQSKVGAVYLAVFFKNPPPMAEKHYVNFIKDKAEVVTSRYRYKFNTQNFLVVRGVDMLRAGKEKDQDFVPVLDSSTFYLKADLKYFLTIEVNHSALNTFLEAYKIGPVRVLIRVSFYYSFLKLNFELGMYTEVSFFSNAVFLPAILYNPLDASKSLNKGSGFYYGFAMNDNPTKLKIETNMPKYSAPKLLDFLKTKSKTEPVYWISATGEDRMMYVEISPSKQMRAAENIPSFYVEDINLEDLKKRKNDAQPLGKSPVNMALYLDLTKLQEGEHLMTFRLYFENYYNKEKLDSFKTLTQWSVRAERLKI